MKKLTYFMAFVLMLGVCLINYGGTVAYMNLSRSVSPQNRAGNFLQYFNIKTSLLQSKIRKRPAEARRFSHSFIFLSHP